MPKTYKSDSWKTQSFTTLNIGKNCACEWALNMLKLYLVFSYANKQKCFAEMPKTKKVIDNDLKTSCSSGFVQKW